MFFKTPNLQSKNWISFAILLSCHVSFESWRGCWDLFQTSVQEYPMSLSLINQLIYKLMKSKLLKFFALDWLKKLISVQSIIVWLKPYIDTQSKCNRFGDRLKQSNFSEFEKHPFILPEKDIFSKLVIQAYHLRNLYSGIQLTLGLREKYWVIRAPQVVKQLIFRCNICVHHRGQTMT